MLHLWQYKGMESTIKTPVQLAIAEFGGVRALARACLLYTSPSPRDRTRARMPSSA